MAANEENITDGADKNDDDSGDSMNMSDTNESLSEMKKETAIPILKNNEKPLKNKNAKVKPFSQRNKTKDPYKIANKMIYEINLVAGQLFQLWHKVIEVVTINPKFVCELLHFEYEEKMRERWGENIFRNVVHTKDFAFPSEENVGETHKKIAKSRRSNTYY
jgi:hypothetical protein